MVGDHAEDDVRAGAGADPDDDLDRAARVALCLRAATENQQGETETFKVAYTLGVAPLQQYLVAFDDGRIHATFTQTGRFVAVPLRAGHPRYTGHFTTWGGFNQNGKTVNVTFTFNVHGKGSDGSTFKNHNVEHFNQRPDGSVNEFFRCH